MSITRSMVASLKIRHDEAPIAKFQSRFAEPGLKQRPASISAAPDTAALEKFKVEAVKYTTAMLAVGRCGNRYPTDLVLQFQAELAVAHAAVASELPDDWFEKQGILSLRTKVENHHQYLLRPDLGRRLNDASLQLLQEKSRKGNDIQIILADGLSAEACMKSGMLLTNSLLNECKNLGISCAEPVGAKFARVWLEDEIGQISQARVAVILLGERPGLGTGDGLSAYMVYNPKIGNSDANRNMMSNIHDRGTVPAQAAKRLALLAQAMIAQNTSGVGLDLTASAELKAAGTVAYREAQKREQLVEKIP